MHSVQISPSLTPVIVKKKKKANTHQTTAPETPSGSQELAAAVDDLLDQLQHKFDNVSTDIFGKCTYYVEPHPLPSGVGVVLSVRLPN